MTLGDTELIPLIRSCAHDMHHVTEEDIRLLAYRLAHSPLQFDPARRRSWAECTCRKAYWGDTKTIGAMEDDPTCPLHHPAPSPHLHDQLLDVRHEEDGSWSVSIRAMPGHIGCADTLEGAYAEAHDAALAWVEAIAATDALDVERLIAFLRKQVRNDTESAAWRHGVEYAIECIEEAATKPALPNALNVERLAAAINDAQVIPSELQLGHDLMPVAERIARKYEKAPAPDSGEPFEEYARRAIADRDQMDRALREAAQAVVDAAKETPDALGRPSVVFGDVMDAIAALRAALAGEEKP